MYPRPPDLLIEKCENSPAAPITASQQLADYFRPEQAMTRADQGNLRTATYHAVTI
jgi:hypothetical protein